MKNYRNDTLFNLEEVSYKELFLGLKQGIVKAINEYENKNVDESLICLNESGCSKRLAYGEDDSLYPKIVLDVGSRYNVMLTPFKIEMLVIDFNIKSFQNKNLTQTLIDFINFNFPDSDYMEKRENYKKIAKIMNDVRDKMIIL